MFAKFNRRTGRDRGTVPKDRSSNIDSPDGTRNRRCHARYSVVKEPDLPARRRQSSPLGATAEDIVEPLECQGFSAEFPEKFSFPMWKLFGRSSVGPGDRTPCPRGTFFRLIPSAGPRCRANVSRRQRAGNLSGPGTIVKHISSSTYGTLGDESPGAATP